MALTTRQTLRLLIGDVDSAGYTLTDDQIDYFLDEHADVPRDAAPDAANAAANVLAMQATQESVGAMSVGLTARAELYRQRARDLGGSVGLGLVAGVYVGGISQSEIDSSKEDESLPPRAFTVGLHDYPGTINGTTSDDD